MTTATERSSGSREGLNHHAMNTERQGDVPEDFVERFRRIERDLSLKEEEIRAIRQNLRKVEAAYWEHLTNADRKPVSPDHAPANPLAPASTPPPLPSEVDVEAIAVIPLDDKPSVPESDGRLNHADEPELAAPVDAAPAPAEPMETEPVSPAPTATTKPVSTPVPAGAGVTTRPFAPAPEKRKGDLETRIGAVWFNRIGLVILIIGFALMARLIVPSLQPWMKLAAMYLASWALLGAGIFFDRRYPSFARPVVAGAMALTFFASFAGHYVEATACLPLTLSLLFMFISTVCVLLFAERWDSEPTAGLAVFLGHVAAYVGGVEAGTVPLAAILLLTGTAAALFVRHGWQPLNLFAVVAAFVSHFLWYMQDRGPQDPAAWFWLNFAFLTSYYAIFLLADLVLRHKGKEGSNGIGGVGPLAMVLYSASTVTLFYQTGVYWSALHVYLLGFAALQAGLAALYALRKQGGYSLYAVAAVLFTTLGVFAWLDGLTLTLTLAVEGVVVMMLARRDRFRFMYPVAQLVLGAGFCHYWTWGAAPSSTWPELLSNLVAALAFLVAAYLEEHWPEPRVSTAAGTPRPAMGWIHPPAMAALHAIGAGTMAAYQLGISLSAPSASMGLAMAALTTLVLALVLRARCWAWAIWILQLRLTAEMLFLYLNAADGPRDPVALDILWQLHQAVALALTGGAAIAVLLGFARRRAHALVTGAGMLVLGLGIPALAALVGRPTAVAPAMVLATPILYWILGAMGRRPDTRDWRVGKGWLRPTEKALIADPGLLRAFFSFLGAALLSVAVWAVYPADLAILCLSAAAGVALAAVALLDAPALAAGLMLHLLLLVVRMVWAHLVNGVTVDPLTVNWALSACVIPALGLGYLAYRRRRGSLALAAHSALACFVYGALAARAVDLPMGESLWIWLGQIALAWLALEWMAWVFLPHRMSDAAWRDRYGYKLMQGTAGVISMVHTCALTFLLALVLASHFAAGIELCWAFLVAAAVLVVAALALRSARFATAATLTTAAVYLALLDGPGLNVAVLEHPAFVICLVLFTLGQGVSAEFIRRTLLASGKAPRWQAALSFLGPMHYLVGLALALTSIEYRFIQDTPYVLPVQGLFLLALFLPGMTIRLPRLVWFVLGALALAVVVGVLAILDGAESYRLGLLPASLIVVLQLMLVERILDRTSSGFLNGKGRGFTRAARIAAVTALGLQIALACLYAAGLQGYLTTLGWSVAGLVLMSLGFVWNERTYRYTALALFLLGIGRAILVDISGLSPVYRTLAFICLGACLLAVSFLYTRFKDRIQKWL